MRIVATQSLNHRRCGEIKSRRRNGKVKTWRVMHVYQCLLCRHRFPEILLHNCEAKADG
jgi:hypothetical protein